MIPDRILSKSSGSAVHSCWHSPVQGGIATSVEHMLFVETPESMSFFIFFQSPAFQATRLFKPSVCGWSNSHESFYHPQYIKLPLLHTPFLRGHICVYLVKLVLFVWMNIIHPSHTKMGNKLTLFLKSSLCGWNCSARFLEKCWFVWEELSYRKLL